MTPRVHDVRAAGAASARVVAHGAAADRRAARSGSPDGQPADRHASDRAQQADRQAAEAEDAGREGYFVYPDGMGRSKLTPNLIEKHLGGAGTARNWNTVLKVLALTRA